MTITMNTKPKPKTPLKSKAVAPKDKERISVLVDEVAGLILEVKAIAEDPRVAKLAAAKTELIALIDDVEGADVKGTLVGVKFRCDFGKKGLKREVTDIERVFEMMGAETFAKVCSVPLTALDDYLTPEERAEVIKEERVNARRLKFIPIE